MRKLHRPSVLACYMLEHTLQLHSVTHAPAHIHAGARVPLHIHTQRTRARIRASETVVLDREIQDTWMKEERWETHLFRPAIVSFPAGRGGGGGGDTGTSSYKTVIHSRVCQCVNTYKV